MFSDKWASRICYDPISTAIGVGGSLVSGLLGKSSAKTAADQQTTAANNALAVQQAQQAQTRADLLPYNTAGQQTVGTLQQQLPYLTSAFNPTMAQLAATPGYQFALQQGQQAVTNSNAAKGLGVSGAALRGAADYATGLADNTYMNQFNVDQANKTNAYNKLMGLINTGENAAAQTGSLGQQSAANSGNLITSAGNAQASGTVGGNNALTGGINNAANTYLTSDYLQQALANQRLATASKSTTAYGNNS